MMIDRGALEKRVVFMHRGCIGSLFIRIHPVSNYTTILHIGSQIHVSSQSSRTVCLLSARIWRLTDDEYHNCLDHDRSGWYSQQA
jgi:hypothetical protein